MCTLLVQNTTDIISKAKDNRKLALHSVSVIIPAYNEAEYISECLQTLETQTLIPLEVIVVDDGSTDETAKIAESFGATIIHIEHRGPGYARNVGAESAKGEILAFLDADMSFDPQFLEYLIKPLGEGERGTFSKDELVGNWDNPWARCWSINLELPDNRRHPPGYPDKDGVFRAIRKEDFISIGGYDDSGYSEDVSISRKLRAFAVRAPGAICYHNNPSTLREVFLSARWCGRGDQIGHSLSTALLHTFPYTIKYSITRSIRYRCPHYPIFKIVYDLGVLAGMLGRLIDPGNHMK